LLLALLGLAGFVLPAAAQDGTSITGIMTAAGSTTDAASGFFRFILGNFWDNPLAAVAGGSTGLFGAMFAVFNAVIFVVGVFWASYGIGGAVADTAQSGEALGKRISLVWMPIRMVTGIAGIVPVFGGFSLSQVILVLMATIGIGMANMMTNAAVDAASSFQTLMSPAAAVSSSNKVDYRALALQIFRSNVCMLASQDLANAGSGSYSPMAGDQISFPQRNSDAASNEQDYFYGSTNSPSACGGYKIITVNGTSNSFTASTFGFRTGAVNYSQFNTQLSTVAQSSVTQSMTQLNTAAAAIARQWYQSRQQATNSTSVPFPLSSLNAAADAARDARIALVTSAVQSVMSSADGPGGAIPTEVSDNMKSQGFAGVGAWYSAFAEASSAFTNALDSVTVSSASISDGYLNGPSIGDALASVDKSTQEGAQADDNGDTVLSQWMCKTLLAQAPGVTGNTATGNCSLGQAIVQKAISGASGGSGGGAIVNPIIMFKSMGDDVLTLSSGLTAAIALADFVPTTGAAGGVLQMLPGGKIASGLAKKIGSLTWVLPYLVVLGLFMSIYIPMIPFITWMGGITQYVVIFCQGIVGMPIAAFAHLDVEGDGMGRRTEAGYMFVLNVTFRPALMLFGFFMASGLMLVLGTFQASLFMTAMANAQGNSITGFYSVIGYLVLFAVMNITLIQSLFNMIYLLPDQVLSLVGSAGHMADLGKDAEHKIHALFTSTGRTAQSAVASMKPDKQKPGANKGPDDGKSAAAPGG
jgi:conjugal transfer/type IV secretion protein DotA/TraY